MKEEKYIKEKLTDYESPMNMEAMWADLEKNLDETEDRKGGFWLWGKGFLTSLAVLVFSGILFFMFRNSSTTQQTISEAENIKTEKTINSNTVQKQDTEVLENDIKSIKQSATLETITENETVLRNKTSQSLNSISTTSKNAKLDRNRTKKLKSQKKVISKTFTSDQTTRSSQKVVEPKNTELFSSTKSSGNSAIISVSTNAINTTDIVSAALIGKIAMLNNNKAFLDWTRVLDLKFPSIALPKAPRIRTSKKKAVAWRVTANYGLSVTDPVFTGNVMGIIGPDDILNDLNRTHKPAINNTYGIGIERVSSKGLKFSIGLNYLNQGYIYTDGDEFIANTDQETTTVFISDSGSFIGEEENVVQVTEGVYTWRYRDYRSWNSFQLPIMVGYEKRKNKLDYSVSAGLAMNLLGSPSEILDYSEETRRLAENKEIELSRLSERTIFLEDVAQALSGIAKTELGYSLRKRLRIFASLEAGRSLQKFGYGQSGIVHVSHFGTRTGLSYAF